MKERLRSGFTLVELLVVVAIMGLLAAILFPVFTHARDTARRTRCLSNLRQIALAHQMYVLDHDDALPSWQVLGPRGFVVWLEYLRPYYRDARILDDGPPRPVKRSGVTWLADYALCAWGPAGKGTLQDPYWRWPGSSLSRSGWPPMLLAEVRRPDETLQFTDGGTVRYAGPQYDSFIRRRHRNGLLNGAFVDGSARVITEAEWNRVGRDERGYFYAIAAADR